MSPYKAPLRDIFFCLKELIDFETVRTLPGNEDLTDDLVEAILTKGAQYCEEVLWPLNQSGDQEGCRLEKGQVYTPRGFKEAYQTFVQGGWAGLNCDPAYGGQGISHIIKVITEEMMCSANLSFGLYPGLTRGAYLLLHSYGTPDLKEQYLSNLAQGIWTGTMCLTESQCGTDLGLIRTKAEPDEDMPGRYKITGNKIFISSGDHNLTENIIHFVLARTPEAPQGMKGISLFLVPKFKVNSDGSLGALNGVTCTSLEHKMGIKASATCAMNFEAAEGFLLGELYHGVSQMFVMMNTERLGVGMQGLGIAEVSYQNALAYARERLQGRALSGPQFPDLPADPILVHPDVRRMLLTMKALNEGNRMLAIWVSQHMDQAHKQPDLKKRQESEDFVQLMTPVVKAFLSDSGFEVANLGMQVYGGHGYIRDHGMEQYVRDARIAQLYEGTNGIQALDFAGRKLSAHMGRYLRTFFHPIQLFIQAHQEQPDLEEFITPLAKVFDRLQQAILTTAQKSLHDPNEMGAASTDLLRLFAWVALSYLWARAVVVSHTKLSGSETDFYHGKIQTARFFMKKLLPQTSGLFASIMAGPKPLMDIPDSRFGPF